MKNEKHSTDKCVMLCCCSSADCTLFRNVVEVAFVETILFLHAQLLHQAVILHSFSCPSLVLSLHLFSVSLTGSQAFRRDHENLA